MDVVQDTWESPHPWLLNAKYNFVDDMKWFEAINHSYSDQFLDAAPKEIDTITRIGAWEKVIKEKGMNILKCTWVFKIKRFPNDLIRKLKGDIVCEGICKSKRWILKKPLHLLSIG